MAEVGETGSLAGKAGRALGWSFANTILSRVATFAFAVWIARLLGPEQFGIFGFAMVVQLAVLSFNELGVSLAIVRWPGDPKEIAPTVSTISVVSSTIIYVGCYFGAPLFADLMDAPPEAANVVRVLTLSVIVSGIVATPVAMLQRNFRQDRKMIADLVSSFASALTSVGCALAGLGAMSVAIGTLSGSVVGAVLFISFAPTALRFGFNAAKARQLLRFGMPLAGSSIVLFAASNVDKIVVGAIFGVVPLGFYTLASNLANLPVTTFSTPMRAVAPAAFARLQHDRPAMNRAFLTTSSLLGAIALPGCVLLAAASYPLVRLLYGVEFERAAAILPWLAVLAALRILFELVYDYFVVLANTRVVFTIQVIWLLCLAPAIWLGSQLGDLPGTGAAQLAVGLLVVLPLYLYDLRKTGIGARPLAASLATPLAAALAVAGAVIILVALIHNDVLALLPAGIIAVVAMAGLLYRMRHLLKALRGGGGDAPEVPVQAAAPPAPESALA